MRDLTKIFDRRIESEFLSNFDTFSDVYLNKRLFISYVNFASESSGFDINKPFIFVKNLGKGSFGRVDLVRQNGKEYAEKNIKVTKSKGFIKAKQEAYLDQTINEACSRGTAKYYGSRFLLEEKLFKIYTEYIDGIDLMKITKNGIRLNHSTVKKIAVQLLKIVNCLHSHNIVHNDIKLDNIVIKTREKDPSRINLNQIKNLQVYLIDFGGSCFSKGSEVYECRNVSGTPRFLSPEEIKAYYDSNKKIENYPLTDVWSLGAVIYFLMYNRNIQPGKSIDSLFKNIINKQIEFYKYPIPELEELVRLMLIKDPQRRPKIENILKYVDLKNAGPVV